MAAIPQGRNLALAQIKLGPHPKVPRNICRGTAWYNFSCLTISSLDRKGFLDLEAEAFSSHVNAAFKLCQTSPLSISEPNTTCIKARCKAGKCSGLPFPPRPLPTKYTTFGTFLPPPSEAGLPLLSARSLVWTCTLPACVLSSCFAGAPLQMTAVVRMHMLPPDAL